MGAVPATPIPRPLWLRAISLVAIAGIVVWPPLALLGLLGAVPAQAVLNVGLVTAALAYLAIRRIRQDRAIALGADPDIPDPPDAAPGRR
jgi:hypothetical protein